VDFSLNALYEALDRKRRASGLTWTAVAREISRSATTGRPIVVSTMAAW
jgi:uncharacterized protein YfiM (DUF2279 family)